MAPRTSWESVIAREGIRMNGTPIADEVVVIDRELALALVAEALSEVRRTCGRQYDARLLEGYALEAAIALLSRPAKVLDDLPQFAARRVRDSLARRSLADPPPPAAAVPLGECRVPVGRF
jgi:hypothetical protein